MTLLPQKMDLAISKAEETNYLVELKGAQVEKHRGPPFLGVFFLVYRAVTKWAKC